MTAVVQLMTITAQLKKAGITIPDAGHTPPPTIAQPTRAQIAEAVTKAHTKGTDPAADPEVQKLTTAHVLAGMNISAELAAGETLAKLQNIRDQRDDILDQLTESFDEHASTLQEIAPVLGTIPLVAGTAVAPQHAADFNRAYQANQAIERIREAWGAVNNGGGQHRNPLTICAPSHKQWDAHRLTVNSTRTAWELVSQGIQPTLARDLAALDDRAASIKRQEHALTEAHEEAYRESTRNTYRDVKTI